MVLSPRHQGSRATSRVVALLSLALAPGCPGDAPVDLDGDGDFLPADCDDDNRAVGPSAEEICGNGVDDDCDGSAAGCGPAGMMSLSDADGGVLGVTGGGRGTALFAAGIGPDGAPALAIGTSLPNARTTAVYIVSASATEQRLADSTPIMTFEPDLYDPPQPVLADLDGDGQPDLTLGTPRAAVWWNHQYFGVRSLDLYLGPLGPRSAEPDVHLALASSVYTASITSLGDTDGDGVGGLLIEGGGGVTEQTGIWALQGPFTASTRLRDMGTHLRCPARSACAEGLAAGDTDGDGLDDVFATGPGDIEWSAGIYVLPAPFADDEMIGTRGPVVQSATEDVVFQTRIAVGDANGDGLADLLITARGGSRALEEQVVTLVFAAPIPPDAKDADATLTVVDREGRFSDVSTAAFVGDVDGDGDGEFVVADSYYGCWGRGCALLVRGGQAGTVDTAAAGAVLVGQDQSGQAGSMLTAAGDVDADGFADLWIGEPYRSFADGSQGAAWLVRGGPGF